MRFRNCNLTSRRTKGFTAVEIAMVATVIAIISLLILPIFRQRTDEAREAAVFDELSTMAKMMLLVEADIGGQPRLQDLDNPVLDDAELLTMMPWNGTATKPAASQFFNRSTILDSWAGPYVSYSGRNSALIEDEVVTQYWYSDGDDNGFIVIKNSANANNGNGSFTPARGPLAVESDDPYDQDLYPLDPWGNPYVFFGKNGINDTESSFKTSILVSFGPDGVVGATGIDIGANPDLYRRYDGAGTGEIGNFAQQTTSIDNPGDFIYRF